MYVPPPLWTTKCAFGVFVKISLCQFRLQKHLLGRLVCINWGYGRTSHLHPTNGQRGLRWIYPSQETGVAATATGVYPCGAAAGDLKAPPSLIQEGPTHRGSGNSMVVPLKDQLRSKAKQNLENTADPPS